MVDIAPVPIPIEVAETFSTLLPPPESRYGDLSTSAFERQEVNDWLYDGLTTRGLL